jgi:hypothetical protein
MQYSAARDFIIFTRNKMYLSVLERKETRLIKR